MGEFDMNVPSPNDESTDYDFTARPSTPLPNDEYDVLYSKYSFSMYRYIEMLQENNIYDTNPHADVMYIDLAWQAICKYLFCEYDDSAMLQRCSFAVAQLAYVYYYNDRVKREVMSGKSPVTQTTIGSHTVTFGSKKIELDSNGLTADVKASLPARKLRVF